MMVVLDLPEDLIEDILCRVPATSLKRLRSTCKRWDNLFNDKRFTRKHLNKAAKQFLVLMLRKYYKICLMSVNLHHEIPSMEVTHELRLNDSHSNSAKANITRVFHCDGLLLCTFREHTRIVVWNPFTGQTKWIHHRNIYKRSEDYTLGSSGNNNSYKILCYSIYGGENREFEIYEINSNSNSNSWRILEVTPPYCNLTYISSGVSLKGKTYWFSEDKKQKHLGMFLVSFDYTREKFGRLCLPLQCLSGSYEIVALSVVREEKLSAFLQQRSTLKTEIWVTNKIDDVDDETKVVSWSKVLTVDYYPKPVFWINFSFLVDEEKKVVLCCENNFDPMNNAKEMVYIVGDDNKVTQVNLGASSTFRESTIGSCGPVILSYVPSLVQIEQGGGSKRKRGD